HARALLRLGAVGLAARNGRERVRGREEARSEEDDSEAGPEVRSETGHVTEAEAPPEGGCRQGNGRFEPRLRRAPRAAREARTDAVEGRGPEEEGRRAPEEEGLNARPRGPGRVRREVPEDRREEVAKRGRVRSRASLRRGGKERWAPHLGGR